LAAAILSSRRYVRTEANAKPGIMRVKAAVTTQSVALRSVNKVGVVTARRCPTAKLDHAALCGIDIWHGTGGCAGVGIAAPQIARLCAFDYRPYCQVRIGSEEEIDNPGMGAVPL